uniref:Cytoskeleton-associated protein 4 n=1 Tax=Tetraodon nigroviridis TaxID=99883 RepID=H3C6N7_TETNG
VARKRCSCCKNGKEKQAGFGLSVSSSRGIVQRGPAPIRIPQPEEPRGKPRRAHWSRPRSRSCLGLLCTTVFYVAAISAAGFAAFYLQKVVATMQEATSRQEESARQSADMATRLDGVVLQMNGLKSAIDRLESSVGTTRAELEGATRRMKTNELETRRVEETLQKLQNDLLRDLSEGIGEVKEAREKDFSSLEKTVEERLAEVSQSIKVSLEEFTKTQGEAQSQLADLRARLGHMEDPALIKQELSAIVDVVAEIKTAKQTSQASEESLGEQIEAVRAELQIRNQEVASLSQEVETALKDRSEVLGTGVEQVTEAVRHVETQVNEAETRARRQADDLEARAKASEAPLGSKDSDLDQLVKALEVRLAAVEDRSSQEPEQLRSLRSTLASLEAKAAKLEQHEEAIASLQRALE